MLETPRLPCFRVHGLLVFLFVVGGVGRRMSNALGFPMQNQIQVSHATIPDLSDVGQATGLISNCCTHKYMQTDRSIDKSHGGVVKKCT